MTAEGELAMRKCRRAAAPASDDRAMATSSQSRPTSTAAAVEIVMGTAAVCRLTAQAAAAMRLLGTNDRLARPSQEAVHGGKPGRSVSNELRQRQDHSSSPAVYLQVSSQRGWHPSNHEGALTEILPANEAHIIDQPRLAESRRNKQPSARAHRTGLRTKRRQRVGAPRLDIISRSITSRE